MWPAIGRPSSRAIRGRRSAGFTENASGSRGSSEGAADGMVIGRAGDTYMMVSVVNSAIASGPRSRTAST